MTEPKSRRRAVIVIIAAALLLAIATAVILARQRVRRHRVFRTTAGEVKPAPPAGIPPIEQWTETFASLGPADLADLLTRIEQHDPQHYAQWSLGYLHARALIEENEPDEAGKRLAPFLAEKHPLRELALYHRAEIDDADDEPAAASRSRQELILEHRQSLYFDAAMEEELDYLASLDDAKPLLAFAERVRPVATTIQRRDMDARIVESLLRTGDQQRAIANGLALLRGDMADDASDRVSRALDKPELLPKLTPEQWALLAETLRNHRHFERAAALFAMAIPRLPARQDELRFARGRALFGDEKFAEAQQVYLEGARKTTKPDQKTPFLWHAARSAQLRGDDATAEKLMTEAIAVPGKFPATLAALTQRLRTRLKQKMIAEAQGDLALLRKLAPNERAIVEGTLAYAVGMLGQGNPASAVVALNAIPPKLLNAYDRSEVAYWRGRALEARDPAAAFRDYLAILRSGSHSHYETFARQRLAGSTMAPTLARELAVREAQVRNLAGAKKFDLAKRLQSDRVLLSRKDEAKQLAILRDIYRELPDYRAVLELQPKPLPKFPLASTENRGELLMALGLSDEAVDAIEKRWALRPAAEALTRSLALNRGGAARESIYAAEVLMQRVPDDFVPELLPPAVRQLLYPRYFLESIDADAKRFDADPTLVLSIMREESRFDPRAKSVAAARGLLQFIITTAREIGRTVGLVEVEPEDLYDPRIIIRLGAKYVSELGAELDGNRYRIAAAYNAGPKQTALWSRMQSAPGDDYFFASVNFDETKHYVRKVINSYEMYERIYQPD